MSHSCREIGSRSASTPKSPRSLGLPARRPAVSESSLSSCSAEVIFASTLETRPVFGRKKNSFLANLNDHPKYLMCGGRTLGLGWFEFHTQDLAKRIKRTETACGAEGGIRASNVIYKINGHH